jgi:hypothetical protein
MWLQMVVSLPLLVAAQTQMRLTQFGANNALGRLGRTDETRVAEPIAETFFGLLSARGAENAARMSEREALTQKRIQFHSATIGPQGVPYRFFVPHRHLVQGGKHGRDTFY